MALFQTGNAEAVGNGVLLLQIPRQTWYKRALIQALFLLTQSYNWAIQGDVSIEDAVQLASESYETYVMTALTTPIAMADGVLSTSSNSPLYTVPSNLSQSLTNVLLINSSGSSVQAALTINRTGTGRFVALETLAGNQIKRLTDLQGIALEGGDTISGFASVNSVITYMISGETT